MRRPSQELIQVKTRSKRNTWITGLLKLKRESERQTVTFTWDWLRTGLTESDTYIILPVSHVTTNRKPSAASRIKCFNSWSVKNDGLYVPSELVLPVPAQTKLQWYMR